MVGAALGALIGLVCIATMICFPPIVSLSITKLFGPSSRVFALKVYPRNPVVGNATVVPVVNLSLMLKHVSRIAIISLAAVQLFHCSLIPSFLDDRESLFERAILHDDFAEPFHEGPQSRFGHSRDQFVEHAALAEERMGAMLGGVGLEMAVHAETFSGGAEQRQENDGEGVEEKQPVAPLGV